MTAAAAPSPRYLWIRLALFEKQLAIIIDHLVQNSRWVPQCLNLTATLLFSAASRVTVTGHHSHSVRVVTICTVHQILFILPKWVAWAARLQVLTSTSSSGM
jgi:hypothetical protein